MSAESWLVSTALELPISCVTIFIHFPFIDIDECFEKKDGCEMQCINNAGSFECLCSPGYQLESNKRNCTG